MCKGPRCSSVFDFSYSFKIHILCQTEIMEISLAIALYMLIYLLNKSVRMLTQEESGQLEGFSE